MLQPGQVCPNCHGSTRPHTWVVDLDEKCAICGRPALEASPLARVVGGKIQGLRAELKILSKMFMHSFAFDGQLHLAQGLMADLVALRQMQGELLDQRRAITTGDEDAQRARAGG